jgi:hypothetical protein
MAACYLAGILTMRFWNSSPSNDSKRERIERRDDLLEKNRQERADPKVQHKPDSREKKSKPVSETSPSALALEWQALDSKANRAELYRQAGDRYLEESNDVGSALRCYRAALAVSPARDLTISTKDNWVLMVAKQERQ